MKDNYDINRVRKLLIRYYSAETSPDEEEYLERFFSDVDIADLPDDLASSRKIFAITMQLRPSITECEVPDNLTDKLNSIIAKQQPASPAKGLTKFQSILRYSGVAVAACIALSFIMVFMRQYVNDSLKVKDYDAEVVAETSKDPHKSVSFKIPETETELHVPEMEHLARQAKTTEKIQDNEDEDGFLEITDPAEAQRIMLEIGKLLAQNASETQIALCDVANSFESYKEISKSILQ